VRIVANADGSPCPTAGCYVKHYTADGWRGLGHLVVTDNTDDARQYRDAAAAFADWKRTSTTHPVRPDGKPNRPLTAYTVEFINVP
jgi:hypothetical protein